MGLSGSRGKRVAPASGAEKDLSTQTLTCQTSSVSVGQKNTRLSNRQVADERNLAAEVDRMLDACEDIKNWDFQKIPLHMCETSTLCFTPKHQRDIDAESTHTADPILPAELFKPGGLEDKKNIYIVNKINKSIKKTAITALRADPLCTKTLHVPGICDNISLALPVSYDASEEDLMSEIEREFG